VIDTLPELPPPLPLPLLPPLLLPLPPPEPPPQAPSSAPRHKTMPARAIQRDGIALKALLIGGPSPNTFVPR
jgi:hypothetical protein